MSEIILAQREGEFNSKTGELGEFALGNTTKSVTPPNLAERRIRHYRLQEVAQDLLPGDRIGACMKHIVPGRSTVDVMYSKRVKRAHLKGVMRCGSVWVCPVCSSTITERRRVELGEALARRPDLVPVLVTVTLQHHRGDPLAELVGDLNESWRRVKRGDPWGRQVKRLGIRGYVSALEVTFGLQNGWHPHKHVLFLMERAPGEEELERFRGWLAERFGRFLAKVGRYSSPIHGIDIKLGDDQAADYVTKQGSSWGLDAELTKAPVKSGRSWGGYSPFELLELYEGGKRWAGALFQEYADALKGRRQLVFSRGLRDYLVMGQELSDAELVELEEEPAEVLVSLTREQWRQVVKRGGRGVLLEVASTGNRLWVWAYLVGLGVPGARGELCQESG